MQTQSPHVGGVRVERARAADTHRSAVRVATKNFILFNEIGESVECLNL